MKIELNAIEARVIGCLIEKEVTTPDYYPMTLNSLTTACNQKSNREPVLSLTEIEVRDALDSLVAKRLVSDNGGSGTRVTKFQHRFCNTEFGDLSLSSQEIGILCCLLLRGAQTPGELRTRTSRLAEFESVAEVESVLEGLVEAERGPLVIKLDREPGKRESRYMHLFCGELDICSSAQSMNASKSSDGCLDRVEILELEVAEIKKELEHLKSFIKTSLND